MVQRGMSVNCAAGLGATPLMVACAARHLDVAELLLNAGADPDLATPDGWRALHVAVRACAAPIVRLLLAEGRTDPDAMSRGTLTHGGDVVPASTPLLIAISLNSTRMIRHLLDAGADLNLAALVAPPTHHSHASLSSGSDSDDATGTFPASCVCSPVQFAVMSRAWDVAELLVRAGADTALLQAWLGGDEHTPGTSETRVPTQGAPTPPTDPASAVALAPAHELPASALGTPAPGAPTIHGDEVTSMPLVYIPGEQASHLRQVLADCVCGPARLSQLARLCVRRLLGRHLAVKLSQLNLPLSTRQYLLYYDLLHSAATATPGTFDI